MNIIKFRSAENQDKWAIEKLSFKLKGYFVDVGAAEGLYNSNTYVLEKHFGWTGICIEPNLLERGFPSLKKNRTCICDNACILDEEKEIEFIARGRISQQSGIFHENATDDIRRRYKEKHPITILKTVTIQSILDKHKAPKVIDYMSIDTEGTELQAVRSIDFSCQTILLLTIEHNYHKNLGSRDVDREKRYNIRHLLKNKGYILEESQKYPHEYDDWFIHQDLIT